MTFETDLPFETIYEECTNFALFVDPFRRVLDSYTQKFRDILQNITYSNNVYKQHMQKTIEMYKNHKNIQHLIDISNKCLQQKQEEYKKYVLYFEDIISKIDKLVLHIKTYIISKYFVYYENFDGSLSHHRPPNTIKRIIQETVPRMWNKKILEIYEQLCTYDIRDGFILQQIEEIHRVYRM